MRRDLYCEFGMNIGLGVCEGYKIREMHEEAPTEPTSAVVQRERRLPQESRQDPAGEHTPRYKN